MKIIYFIKWLSVNVVKQVKGFNRWMWGWAATCFFASMFFSAGKDDPTYMISKIALIILVSVFWIGYVIIYNGIKTAWNKFTAEQEKILNHLKDIG